MEIIPNIPNEIGGECLLRVTYKSHDNLKTMCRNWEAMLSSPWFYEHRKIDEISEQFISLIQSIPKGASADNKW